MAKQSFRMIADKVSLDEKQLATFKLKAVKAAGAFLKDTMADNARNLDSGRDADGNKMKGYSSSYVKQIQAAKRGTKAGKTSKNKGFAGLKTKDPSTTDLAITGTLRESQRLILEVDRAAIAFQGQHYSGLSNAELADALERMGFVDWYGIPEKNIKKLNTMIETVLDEVMDKTITIKKNT